MVATTRSRQAEVLEDLMTINDSLPLPQAHRFDALEPSQRPPLANITQDNIVLPEQVARDAEVKTLKAAFKKAIGVGKKKNKKNKHQNATQQAAAISTDSLVLDDARRSAPSPAAEEVRQLLSSCEEDTLHPVQDEISTSQSQAIQHTRRQLAEEPLVLEPIETEKILLQEPKVIKEHLQQPKSLSPEPVETGVDATMQLQAMSVDTMEVVESAAMTSPLTPSKSPRYSSVEVFDILSPMLSPTKSATRIEDTVEELDRFEDELEVSLETLDLAVLRAASPRMVPSGKSSSPKKTVTIKAPPHPEVRETAASIARKAVNHPAAYVGGSLRVKSTQARQSLEVARPKSALVRSVAKPQAETTNEPTTTAKRTIKRPTSLLPPKPLEKSMKPPTRSTFELPGDAVARKLKEAREARLSGVNTSSSAPEPKPATVARPRTRQSTVPSFELPGEALSRRKKEQQEARLKQQEEEERKRREFKARPIRKSVAAPGYVPRETAASRARHSMVAKLGDDNNEVSKRQSVVGSHRPSIATTSATMANTSVRRLPPKTPGSPVVQTQRTVSAEHVKLQRQRAKEIYKRDSQVIDDMNEERRRREEAARKARLEAAERGRQASREWAEKQRAKKMMEAARTLETSATAA